ncbi:hypothetical protein K2Z83_11590 [Oscillochloris sp. ZM17-4]|uniref:hypothetical protein n=1 Tax=Oscillochloris sp. ZM17-4 TaxID=2866714 RepID=UPI001C730382|nr:hypothetical protein [Oscillochloris sp. ZM17-4]MBX0328318.1 hypothetical protein [Oscillochloris sp. ZM17-4]
MYQAETIHKYPRLLTTIIELLCVLLVVLTSARIGFIFLRALWDIYGRNDLMIDQVPLLPGVVGWIESGAAGHAVIFGDLWPALIVPLGWSALALFATIILRNTFPAVRASAHGLLVEFAGSWLPIPWERLLAAKVTADLSGEHFILLVQADRGSLTFWHRLYSLFYGLSWRAGFYITSNISEFDQLVQTILSESERTARASETARPVRLQEDAPSPLFRLLLSPGAFFSRGAAVDAPASAGAAARPSTPGGAEAASYPSRITTLIGVVVAILAVLAGLRYLSLWSSFIALEIPALRDVPPFIWNFGDPRYRELYNAYRTPPVPFLGVAGRPDLPAPWWILIAAHLMLLLAIAAILWLRNLLPAIESREQGIAVRDTLRGRWLLVSWDRVRALKLTEISEQSQILLLQGRGMPSSQRLTSLLYDGSLAPGVLITSAISNFQPMLQHALGHITTIEAAGGPPVLRQDARSSLLWMAFGGRAAREALVADARADAGTRVARLAGLLPSARTMAVIALPPALLIGLGGLLSDRVPSVGLIVAALALWIFGMLEWPLIGLISVLLDDNTGGGEEGYRAFYLYPTSQLPRLLPLVAAIILQIVGVPLLPALAWIGAMAWAFWLGRGLWEALYEWRGSQAILGGLLPVFWQLLLLIGYLVATR